MVGKRKARETLNVAHVEQAIHSQQLHPAPLHHIGLLRIDPIRLHVEPTLRLALHLAVGKEHPLQLLLVERLLGNHDGIGLDPSQAGAQFTRAVDAVHPEHLLVASAVHLLATHLPLGHQRMVGILLHEDPSLLVVKQAQPVGQGLHPAIDLRRIAQRDVAFFPKNTIPHLHVQEVHVDAALPINQRRADAGEVQDAIVGRELEPREIHCPGPAMKGHPIHPIDPGHLAIGPPHPLKARGQSRPHETLCHPLVRDNLHHLLFIPLQQRRRNHPPLQPSHPLVLLSIQLRAPFKSHLPIALGRRESKGPVEPHLVDEDAARFVPMPAQSAPHHLQVLGQRERRSSHLDKLHVGTIKPLRKEVHTHQHLG